MKRLWPLPVLLLLALPARAQDGEESGSVAPEAAEPVEAPEPAEDKAPAEPPVTEPGGEEPAPQGGAAANGEEGGESDVKPAKQEAVISVKVATPAVEEGDEDESVTPAVAPKKVVPTATLMKAPKKGKATPSAKGAKVAKGKMAPSPILKKPAVAAAPEAPPPAPAPAVPLTPITPRNP